ncbi:MAG: hypothetical protein HUU20_25780 [Pirellulales bacterium]|nr:hypothetical protein [Pirellulales bacterium]
MQFLTESRLRVLREDLTVDFGRSPWQATVTPLVHVTAAYSIENATDQEIRVDFGFPILRGIYINPVSMLPAPDVFFGRRQ